MLKILLEKVGNIHEHIRNFNRKVKTTRSNKMLEIKKKSSKATEICNAFNVFLT